MQHFSFDITRLKLPASKLLSKCIIIILERYTAEIHKMINGCISLESGNMYSYRLLHPSHITTIYFCKIHCKL